MTNLSKLKVRNRRELLEKLALGRDDFKTGKAGRDKFEQLSSSDNR